MAAVASTLRAVVAEATAGYDNDHDPYEDEEGDEEDQPGYVAHAFAHMGGYSGIPLDDDGFAFGGGGGRSGCYLCSVLSNKIQKVLIENISLRNESLPMLALMSAPMMISFSAGSLPRRVSSVSRKRA